MTVRLTLGIVLAVIVAASYSPRAQSNPPQASMQAAIKLELIEGNLTAAIDMYKELSRHTDPATAAEALVRLARSYEKIGHADTRRTYEQVVRDYPGQTTWAAEARAWLAARPARSEPATGRARAELLWSGRQVNLAGRPSPDGRHVSFIQWSPAGNLALRDLSSGEVRRLTTDATLEEYAAQPIFSPDGRQIAYLWNSLQDQAVRIINVDGTGRRDLIRPQPYGLSLQAWSPDGRHIAAVRYNYDDRTAQIQFISTADGSITTLKSTGWRYPELGDFSPDGRFLVYAFGKAGDDKTGGVYAIATDLSREVTLIEDEASYSQPRWSPSGRQVLFVSDRSGTEKPYTMRVADGEPAGPPELLSFAGATVPQVLGFDRRGSFYYGTTSNQSDAYVAGLDAAGQVLGEPRLIATQFRGMHFGPELSPDGRYAAFFRRTTDTGGPANLVVRTLATGEERTLASLDVVYHPDRNVQWFPDSRTVLLQENIYRPVPGAKRFRAINVQTGEDRLLFEGPFEIWRTAALSPDGAWLYYSIFDKKPQTEDGTLRLVKRHLRTGQERELYRMESNGIGAFGLTISRDGEQLAFSVNAAGDQPRVLLLMSSNGGAPRPLYKTSYQRLSPQGAMAFAPDGRSLIALARCARETTPSPTAPTPPRWCSFPLDGGAPSPLSIPVPEGAALSQPLISADGTRVAFTTVMPHRELWVAHNIFERPDGSPR